MHSVEPSIGNIVSSERMLISQVDGELSQQPEHVPERRTFVDSARHLKATAESLAELWHIGLNKAKQTLRATTQRGTRSAILRLSRRYRSDRMYSIKRLQGCFATDTFYSPVKSILGNTCAQIYSHKVGFSACYPLPRANGEMVGNTLKDFVHDFGAPSHLTFDGAQVQMGKNTLFQATLKKHDIRFHVSSPRRPNENPGEAAICEVKRRMYRIAAKKQVPRRFWDYLIVWVCETGNISVSSSRYAEGRTPIEIITGETPDISEYIDFCFYDWITYRTNAGLGPLSIGRWLCVSHKIGQLMSYWVLTKAGHVISCCNVQRLTPSEAGTNEYKSAMNEFDESISLRDEVRDINAQYEIAEIPDWNRLSIDEDDEDFRQELLRVVSDESIPEADDISNQETFDGYINMELGIPRGPDEELQHAVVKRRAIDEDGKPIGLPHNNPIMDTRAYEVEFLDRSTETLTANIIAENIIAQVDEEGHRQLLMEDIIDHQSNEHAVKKEDGFYLTKNGSKWKRMTMKGWQICVQWKDRSQRWVTLKDLKHTYPVELAEYSVRNRIDNELAFAWWFPTH